MSNLLPFDAMLDTAKQGLAAFEPATPVQLGIGVLMLIVVFIYGWASVGDSDGSSSSSGGRDDEGDPNSLMSLTSMLFVSIGNMWLVGLAIVLFLLFVEVAVVAAVRTPFGAAAVAQAMLADPEGFLKSSIPPMLSLRAVLSTFLDRKMFGAVVVSFMLAVAFAYAAMMYLWWRIKMGDSKESIASMRSYIGLAACAMQLAAMMTFVVGTAYLKLL